MALQGAEDMCLPKLETLELYAFTCGYSYDLHSFSAHQEGLPGLCKEIGNLVAMGVLPSLKQVEPITPCTRTYCGAFPLKIKLAEENRHLDHWQGVLLVMCSDLLDQHLLL